MWKPPGWLYGWLVLAGAMAIVALSSGTRFSFGVILTPLVDQFGWDRASASFIASISIFISGLLQPGLGWLVDRWGPKRILTFGLLLLGLGMILTSLSTSLWRFYLAYGVLCGLGFAATTQVVASSLAANWFVRRRGLALSLTGSGGAIGELLVVPLMMVVVLAYGWAAYYRIAALLVLGGLFPLVLLLIRDHPEELDSGADVANGGTAARTGSASSGSTAVARPSEAMSLPQAIRTGRAWVLLYGGLA